MVIMPDRRCVVVSTFSESKFEMCHAYLFKEAFVAFALPSGAMQAIQHRHGWHRHPPMTLETWTVDALERGRSVIAILSEISSSGRKGLINMCRTILPQVGTAFIETACLNSS